MSAVLLMLQLFTVTICTVSVTVSPVVFAGTVPMFQVTEDGGFPLVVQPPVQPMNWVPAGIVSVMTVPLAGAGPVLP